MVGRVNPVFFLYHYNDIDHIAPIIGRCLEEGGSVDAVLLNPVLDVSSDPRIEHLRDTGDIKIHRIEEILDIGGFSGHLRTEGDGFATEVRRRARAGLRRIGVTATRARRFLRAIEADVTIFEWGDPGRRGRREFLGATRGLGLPRLCLPHGLNIYTNLDIHPVRDEAIERDLNEFENRGVYDAYVFQSEYHRDQDIELGIPEEGTRVLGSARYYPQWQETNQALHPDYHPGTELEAETRVVFMLPHWDFYVNKKATLALIHRLADIDWLHLVVKTHTRGSGGFPEEDYQKLRTRPNFELAIEEPSVSLIEWSDAVVNFGSSIGIEALLQDVPLINPSYLHDNRTIFDETGACHRTATDTETLDVLRNLHRGDLDPISQKAKDELFQTVIYGGREPHDVLENYVDLIREFSQEGGR